MNRLKFIILVGISGSGKSTWLNSFDLTNFNVISPDNIRREITGSISDQTKNREVFQISYDRIVQSLNNSKSVVFDATNVSSRDRRSVLDHVKQNVTANFDAYAKVFDADPETSKARIRKDIENGVDRSDVPDTAIDRQYQNFTNDLHKIEADGYKMIN